MMILIYTLSLGLAGVLVFKMWRRVVAYSPAVKWIVTAGVLGRAVGGVVLFWISYLGLPLMKSLQYGDGFWFFAGDGVMYFANAVNASHHGPLAIIFFNRAAPSVFFIQILSLFTFLFGAVPSVAILLNVICFLAAALVLLRWSLATTGGIGAPVLVPLTALALTPSAILWSSQPLKDPLFAFLIVAMAASFAAWQRTWRSAEPVRIWPVVANAAAIWVLLWAIASIRWYFALVVWVTSLVLSVMLGSLVKGRRMVCMAAGAALFIVLAPAFLYGGGPYIPDWMSPRRMSLTSVLRIPGEILRRIDDARKAFDRVGGATAIGLTPATPPARIVVGSPPPSRSMIVKAPESVVVAKPSSPSGTVAAPSASQSAAQTSPMAQKEPPGSVPVRDERSQRATITLPQSRVGRIAAGLTAIVLPRSVARWLYSVDIRGGRGMWLFVDVDTIAFDIVFALAIFAFVRGIASGSIKEPLFWQIAIMTICVSGPLIYAISNFGTLFRHRGMIYVGLALIPLALARATKLPARAADHAISIGAKPLVEGGVAGELRRAEEPV